MTVFNGAAITTLLLAVGSVADDEDEVEAGQRDTVDLLHELQKAADEHRLILMRQSALIERLRNELKDVRR